MTRNKPIVVMFFHHWDDPATRERSVNSIIAVTDLYEKFHVSAHYGFVGAVLQQLAEDSPGTIEQIKRMRMAIGYHGGAGHAPIGPAGHPKDTRSMDWADAVKAMWQFETHTLDVDSHEPVPGKMGGYLAIQSILNIIPLPTDAKGRGQMDTPGEYVLARMGAGSYSIKAPFGRDSIFLSPMHEPHLFPGTTTGWPPNYYGKNPGQDAPRMADPLIWFETLADNLPDDRTFVVHCMSHAGFILEDLDRILGYLASHPENFLITHPDPESAQWQPENSASAFYRRTYGFHDLGELLELSLPPLPSGIELSSNDLYQASTAVLSTSLLNTHDGDFAEPPEFIDIGHRRLSLSSTFYAFAKALKNWKESGNLGEIISVPFIHGPRNYPGYSKQVRPVLPDKQFIGYTPTELPIAELPDANVINEQGLPPSGEYHVWMPTYTIADGQDVINAAVKLEIKDKIPGKVWLSLLTEDSRNSDPRMIEMALNPAEFLYAMAQVYRQIALVGKVNHVALVSMKVVANQRTECVLVKPGGIRDSFIWRSELTPDDLDVAWMRIPAPGEEDVIWMSLPPIGDKVKRKMGRLIGEWQIKKR